ncbi:MAG: 50S ribosomal protein L13 [Firmicutes bacterium]|jgi:large subunit ribosomal protein L13|nr:50S ribosomal protein L13 [Bacillota bacterium]MBQ7049266.1 50S ribosomal protein L13 [Bacillota bacterium]MBR6683375.1 50S ribosomal protein L13 [Bacillota bacterium]
MKTYMPSGKNIERKWYVVDAEGQTLGRLASQVAAILRGKNKPEFTPFLDMGDYVIVVNAEKIHLTGKKLEDKIYSTHTGQPGGLREMSYKQLLATKPELAIKTAVKGMLPKNSLGRDMIKKLKVYAGPEHGHQAQQPEVLTIKA